MNSKNVASCLLGAVGLLRGLWWGGRGGSLLTGHLQVCAVVFLTEQGLWQFSKEDLE